MDRSFRNALPAMGTTSPPPLQWSGVPAGTRSFVVLCDDPDAPSGTWHHWAAYDIPPIAVELAVGAAQDTKMKQAVNDFRKLGYGGPCPSWPRASPLSLPASRPLRGAPASAQQCVLQGRRAEST